MPTFQALLSVALAGLALSATPGPSMLYVLSQTVGQSRAAGFASAIGLCLGGVILAIATALLQARKEVEIEHAGKIYRLRVTQLNKLILTA